MSIKYFQPNESVPRSKLYDMDYLRNLKLNHDKLAIMRPRIDKYQKMIKWKGNAECNNIEEMVQAAKLGLDCGLEKTVELAPVSGFHQWVAYCFVHTRLYNRDRTSDMPELLCIIRMVFLSPLYMTSNCCKKNTDNRCCLCFIFYLILYH